ncbi:MAG: hypothetical protein IPK72_00845 [Candidatus Eisenbacteria bacterium]|nr:hypothetical protein [Candidatus Eisenbacteria bacterium]
MAGKRGGQEVRRRRILWPVLLVALAATRGLAVELRLGDPETPFNIDGYVHSEHAWVGATGSRQALSQGILRWDRGYIHRLRSSLLLRGNLSRSLSLNGAVLFDDRYAVDPYRTWDREYWDHFRLGLALDSPEPFAGGWQVSGNLRLDRDPNWQNRYPDSRLLIEPIEELRLETALELSGPWATVRAGDDQVQLGSPILPLYDRSVLGLNGTLRGGTGELQLLGAKVKGDLLQQTPDDTLGIRADGTSGPYRLAHSPIIRGSEVVTLEVRDRVDPTMVLERIAQKRMVDYTIDYARGVVTFLRPVASETFEDNPVYISLHYSYSARDAGYDRYAHGYRAQLITGEAVRVGATFADEFDQPGSWSGTAPRPDAERRRVTGLDGRLQLGERTSLELAAARSDSAQWNRQGASGAYVATLNSRVIPQLAIKTSYQRYERGFEPPVRRNLSGERDRERFEWRAEIDPNAAARAWIALRQQRDLRTGSDGERATDRATVVGGEARSLWGATLRSELSIRDLWDGKDRSIRDDRHTQARFGLKRSFGSLSLGADYEHERVDAQRGTAEEKLTIHRLKLAPKWSPTSRSFLLAEAKDEATLDRNSERYIGRKSSVRGEAGYRWRDGLSTSVTAEQRTVYDVDQRSAPVFQGTARDRETAASIGGEWAPIAAFRTLVRAETQRARDELSDQTRRRGSSLRHEITADVARDASMRFEQTHSDLEDIRKIGIAGDGSRRIDHEYVLEGTVNRDEHLAVSTGWAFRRRTLFLEGRQTSDLHRLFAGLNLALPRELELTTEVDWAHLEGQTVASGTDPEGAPAADNARFRFMVEVASNAWRHGRIALGHERATFDGETADTASPDYQAGRTYLKVIGKF